MLHTRIRVIILLLTRVWVRLLILRLFLLRLLLLLKRLGGGGDVVCIRCWTWYLGGLLETRNNVVSIHILLIQ